MLVCCIIELADNLHPGVNSNLPNRICHDPCTNIHKVRSYLSVRNKVIP